MAEKEKKGRRAYLNDIEKDKNGEYVYKGAHYQYLDQKMSFGKARGRLLTLCAVMVLCVLAAGCVPAPGMMNTFYLLIPYTVSVAAAASSVYAICRICVNGSKLREYVYRQTVEKVPVRAMVTCISCAVTGAAECLYLLLNGIPKQFGWDILFLILELGCAACAFGLKKYGYKSRPNRLSKIPAANNAGILPHLIGGAKFIRPPIRC